MKTIEETLADRDVLRELKAAEMYLNLRRPDGKDVHDLKSLRHTILIAQDVITKSYRKGITFDKLRREEHKIYSAITNKLTEAIASYGHTI